MINKAYVTSKEKKLPMNVCLSRGEAVVRLAQGGDKRVTLNQSKQRRNRLTAACLARPKRAGPSSSTGQHELSRSSYLTRRSNACVMYSQGEGGDAAGSNPSEEERTQQMKEAYEASLKDPKLKAQMESMQKVMQNPQIQEQMKKQAAQFEDPAFKSKIEALKDDPELKDMFEELKKGGMGALMKFWNDPVMLKKLNDKLQIGPSAGGAAGAPGTGGPSEPPPVEDLLSAAR